MSSSDRPAVANDEGLLDCPLAVRASLYVGYFRSAAAELRASAPAWEAARPYTPAGASAAWDRVGSWIIEAHRFGLLAGAPGIAELVEWHTAPNAPLPAGRQAQRLRSPTNLFLDLAGSGTLLGTVTVLPDGRKVAVPERDARGRTRESGGLLPRLAPGHRELPEPERSAQTCEWLAELIVAAGRQPPADPPTPDQYVTLDKMAALVGRSKRTLEKRKARRQNPLPSPDVEGGGGRPDEWLWPAIRPWLEAEFGRKLPERFPGDRFLDGRANRS